MLKEEKIINYYVLCNKLKDIVRSAGKFGISKEKGLKV